MGGRVQRGGIRSHLVNLAANDRVVQLIGLDRLYG